MPGDVFRRQHVHRGGSRHFAGRGTGRALAGDENVVDTGRRIRRDGYGLATAQRDGLPTRRSSCRRTNDDRAIRPLVIPHAGSFEQPTQRGFKAKRAIHAMRDARAKIIRTERHGS